MFDYTRAAFRKIASNFKNIGTTFHFSMQGVYILYLLYALIAQPQLQIVNSILLALALGYLAFSIVTFQKEKNKAPDAKQQKENVKQNKKTKKRATRIFQWCKQIVNLFPLLILIYNIWRTTENVAPLAVILVSLQLAGWVLGTLFKLTALLIDNTVGLVIEGLKADVEPLTKPVVATGNFFKKLTGQEVPAQAQPNKAREDLEKMVEQEREEKKADKRQANKNFLKNLFHRVPAPIESNSSSSQPIDEPLALPENISAGEADLKAEPPSSSDIIPQSPLEEIAVSSEQKKFWPWKK